MGLSKTKLENIYGLLLNLINMSLYVLAAAASMMRLIVEHSNVSQVLTCLYAFLLSFFLITMEAATMDTIKYFFRFYSLYRGHAAVVILLGSIVIDSNKHPFLLATGVLHLVFGLIYFILSFVPATPIPKPFIENWQNWKEYSAEGLDLERPSQQTLDNAARLKMSMVEKPQRGKINPEKSSSL